MADESLRNSPTDADGSQVAAEDGKKGAFVDIYIVGVVGTRHPSNLLLQSLVLLCSILLRVIVTFLIDHPFISWIVPVDANIHRPRYLRVFVLPLPPRSLRRPLHQPEPIVNSHSQASKIK
jgi:hypothetical protein